MAMVVNHNLPAINAYRQLNVNNSKMSKSIEKLSSGLAINRAGDNAAGLAVSEKMRAQISGIDQAVKNAQDGISMAQTYEGALTETHSILQRMRTLATQSANGTYQDDVDREAIQLEYDQLNDELNQIADTDFNGVVALNGGQMADGTKSVGGVIDYTSKASQRNAKELSASDFVIGDAKGNITADETVTFTYKDDGDGTGTWTQSGGTAGNFGTKDTGGFTYDGIVFSADTSDFVSGDKVTISFKKGSAEIKQAAANGGYSLSGDTKVDAFGAVTVTDATVPASTAAAETINKLQDATIKFACGTDGAVTDSAAGDTVMVLADGTSVKHGTAATAGNPYAANITGGKVEVFAWVDGASKKVLEIAKAAADSADNGDKNGELRLSFADAVYQPKDAGGYEIAGGVTVSESNSNRESTATLTYTDNITLQVGARTKDSVNFTFEYASAGLGELKADLNCSARGLGTDKLSLATQKDANAAIDKIDNAINKTSMVRASFGAMQNRLEHKIDNLNVASENLTAAESSIRDTDMAKEMMNFTKSQILSQASQAMLAQANQLPQGVLQLLQ